MQKSTEEDSLYDNLELLETHQLCSTINQEDQKVAGAVEQALPQIIVLVDKILPKMKKGGRLFYTGAGTSGRLGVVDASECPPTFGVSQDLVQGLIAGGDTAIRTAVEGAEDNAELGKNDLRKNNFTALDSLIGIAASGTTPYVLGSVALAKELGSVTGCITCNAQTPLASAVDYPIEVICGPEFITGSTRMKAGTATKMVLNMISTVLLIKLGHVKGNKMVDMQLSNVKLVDRGARMVAQALNLPYEVAKEQLLKHGSVRSAIEKAKK